MSQPATLSIAALNAVAMIEAFDRDCEAEQYTDTDDAWAIFHKVKDALRAHLDAGQLQELEEMKARHVAEIAVREMA